MEDKLRHKDITAGERNPQTPNLDRTAESEQQRAEKITEVKTSKDPAGFFFSHYQLMILVLGFWVFPNGHRTSSRCLGEQ